MSRGVFSCPEGENVIYFTITWLIIAGLSKGVKLKKAFFFIFIIFLVPVLLSGCGPSKKEHEKLKEELEELRVEKELLQVEKKALQTEKTSLESEKESLQAEKTDLESEVDKLLLDSEGLLNKAQSLYASKRYEEAKSTLLTLVKNYPGSKESKASVELTGKINSGIEKQKAEIERKKQKFDATKRIEKKRRAKAERKKADAKKEAASKKKVETGKKTKRKISVAKKIEVAQATRYMKTRVDNRDGIRWYHDKNSPLYMDADSFQVYFGMKKGSKPLLRLRVQHQGKDWMFVRSFSTIADRKKFIKDPAYFNRGKGHTRTWEWYDESLTDKDIDMIIAVISSTKAVVTFKGAKNEEKYVISSAEKESLRNVLDAYFAVGGEL